MIVLIATADTTIDAKHERKQKNLENGKSLGLLVTAPVIAAAQCLAAL